MKPPVDVPGPWRPLIADYLDTLRAAGRSPKTIELREDQLNAMARDLAVSPEVVTGNMLVKWLAQYPDWASETRRSSRAAARMFFLWAFKSKRIPAHIADDLPAIRVHQGQPRPLPDDAWRAALEVADDRITLILRLAAEAGLRRGEIARVSVGDLIEGAGAAQLLVHGKGNKQRVVPLSESLAELIRQGPPGGAADTGRPRAESEKGWLFPNYAGGHVTPRYIGELAQQTLPPPWTLHACRHRFASRAYRGTRNLRAVQRLLGHASIATTERYTAVDDDEMRAAMMAAVL